VSNLDAFRRHRGEAPTAYSSALISALNTLQASDDPAVMFARLAEACVPRFADSCGVEISGEGQPPFRAAFPASLLATGQSPSAAGQLTDPEQILHTPFRVPSRSGYPPYAGVLTHWWTRRTPTETDAVVADLMAKHVIALVDRERLMAAIARADDQAAELALGAISGRTINMAIGIVMHQRALSPEDAEDLLRRAGAATASGLYEVATSVVRSGALRDPQPARHARGARSRPRPVPPLES